MFIFKFFCTPEKLKGIKKKEYQIRVMIKIKLKLQNCTWKNEKRKVEIKQIRWKQLKKLKQKHEDEYKMQNTKCKI